LEDSADEHVHKDVMITLTTGARKPNKKKKLLERNISLKGVQTSWLASEGASLMVQR
jgi:hypothetical protein